MELMFECRPGDGGPRSPAGAVTGGTAWHRRIATLAWTLLAWTIAVGAQTQVVPTDLGGTWVMNLEESDDPDRLVEKAVRSAGGHADSDGKRGRGRYKGGPKEQEIFDHLLYDEKIQIAQNGPEIHIVYLDGFERRFYTDGRGRTVSASGSSSGDARDFSFGGWAGNTLNVEAKPRDGGWTIETYTLEPAQNRLYVKLRLKPLLFPVEVEADLVYDREGTTPPEK